MQCSMSLPISLSVLIMTQRSHGASLTSERTLTSTQPTCGAESLNPFPSSQGEIDERCTAADGCWDEGIEVKMSWM